MAKWTIYIEIDRFLVFILLFVRAYFRFYTKSITRLVKYNENYRILGTCCVIFELLIHSEFTSHLFFRVRVNQPFVWSIFFTKMWPKHVTTRKRYQIKLVRSRCVSYDTTCNCCLLLFLFWLKHIFFLLQAFKTWKSSNAISGYFLFLADVPFCWLFFLSGISSWLPFVFIQKTPFVSICRLELPHIVLPWDVYHIEERSLFSGGLFVYVFDTYRSFLFILKPVPRDLMIRAFIGLTTMSRLEPKRIEKETYILALGCEKREL